MSEQNFRVATYGPVPADIKRIAAGKWAVSIPPGQPFAIRTPDYYEYTPAINAWQTIVVRLPT